MAAHLLVIRRRLADADRYAQYLEAAAETLREVGASVLLAGAAAEVWEGPPADGVVVVEFRDLEHARTWFHGERYAGVRTLREGAADLELVLVESAQAAEHPVSAATEVGSGA